METGRSRPLREDDHHPHLMNFPLSGLSGESGLGLAWAVDTIRNLHQNRPGIW
jgi:hypothetical protein